MFQSREGVAIGRDFTAMPHDSLHTVFSLLNYRTSIAMAALSVSGSLSWQIIDQQSGQERWNERRDLGDV